MVTKKDVRALIDAVKNNNELGRRGSIKTVIGLINYYMGEVTQEDLDEVKYK